MMSASETTASSSAAGGHGAPIEGKNCMSCWDDLNEEMYVEYRAAEGGEWLPSSYCMNCVSELIAKQWGIYTTALAKTTCKAEQTRLLERGPPINLKDKIAMPCPDDGEVYSVWFMSEGIEKSAKLEGSLTGEERQRYWDEQLAFQFDEVQGEEEQGAEGTTGQAGSGAGSGVGGVEA